MISSRSIDDLDNNVAYNVRVAFDASKAIGLPLGVANTLRDQEYQTFLYQQGKAPAKVTFHAKGLAIDIYINIKGHEYDTSLYPKVAEVFKKVGFSWMWDIAHNEMCHFQWDNHREVTGSMILKGILPPLMPRYFTDKAIIQSHCKFSDPDGVWKYLDKHPYADKLYAKWANSYEVT